MGEYVSCEMARGKMKQKSNRKDKGRTKNKKERKSSGDSGIYCVSQSSPPPQGNNFFPQHAPVFNQKRWVFTPFERAFNQFGGFVKIGHTL